jgi:nuclear pore complex protein Nup188
MVHDFKWHAYDHERPCLANLPNGLISSICECSSLLRNLLKQFHTFSTYQHLHSILSGQLEGTTPNQVVQIVIPRLEQLRAVSAPFGKPSDASRKKIDGGSITLPDGVILHIDETDQEYVLAISNAFNIDQVHSLVLMRSFFYNEGLPSSAGSNSATSLVDEFLEAITPFYFSERLSIIRVLIPLFRANENTADPLHGVADAILPKLLPDGRTFAESLITEYVRKTQEGLPEGINDDPRQASRWVKQNNKEQLVLLEALFWTM